jgi:hypothetical protein
VGWIRLMGVEPAGSIGVWAVDQAGAAADVSAKGFPIKTCAGQEP